jgi:hypothetical protein
MSVPGLTGGEQRPLMKLNARTAKVHVDDKVYDKITMLMDFDNAEVGPVRFGEGTAPDFRMIAMAAVVAGAPFPPMPPDVDAKGKPLFRRGVRMSVKLSDSVAAGSPSVRELASASLATVRAIDKLHTEWLATKEDGKLPVVKIDGWTEVPGQFGSNYAPVFRILKYVDRPPDMRPDARQNVGKPNPSTSGPPAHVIAVPGEPESFDAEDDADQF